MKIQQYTTLILALVLQVSCSKSKDEESNSEKNSHKDNVYEVHGIQIKLPKAPKSKSVNLPVQAMVMVNELHMYEVQSGSSVINITHAISKSDFNIDGSAEGAVSQVKSRPDVSSFESNIEKFSIDHLQARRAKLTFNSSGHSVVQHMLICANGNEWWQVQVIGLKENENELESLSETIFLSIKLLTEPK